MFQVPKPTHLAGAPDDSPLAQTQNASPALGDGGTQARCLAAPCGYGVLVRLRSAPQPFQVHDDVVHRLRTGEDTQKSAFSIPVLSIPALSIPS